MPSIYVYELERWCNRVKRGKKSLERGVSVYGGRVKGKKKYLWIVRIQNEQQQPNPS